MNIESLKINIKKILVELKTEYEKAIDKNEKFSYGEFYNDLLPIYNNSYDSKDQILNDLYDFLVSYKSSHDNVVKKFYDKVLYEYNKHIEFLKQNTPFKKNNNSTSSKKAIYDSVINDEDIKSINDISLTIHALKDSINGLRNNSNDIETNILINKLSSDREKLIIDFLGTESFQEIREIESEEDMVFSQYDSYEKKNESIINSMDNIILKKSDSKYNVSIEVFDKILTRVISSFSLYKFDSNQKDADDKSSITKNELDNYINSLLDIVTDEKNKNELKALYIELLSLLSVYNIHGGYKKFKNNNPSGKIDEQALSKQMYDKSIERIKNIKSRIITIASYYIQKNQGKMLISNHLKDKKQQIFKIKTKLIDMYIKIVMKKNKVQKNK